MSTVPGLSLPKPLRHFFALFPLYTHASVPSPYTAQPVTAPTLWIHAPRDETSDLLSSDVECLKWQAYLALRGLSQVYVRSDVSQDGALEGRLPNLHVPAKDGDPGGELLAAHLISEWVDKQKGGLGELEGYVDEAARDESRSWFSLLEGNVHAALTLSQSPPPFLASLLSPFPVKHRTIETMLNPPPAFLTGISSLIPPYGVHVDRTAVTLQYRDAIAALSDRLGTDRWFLGSTNPTKLDALVFAYLHCILHSKDNAVRIEVSRRVNLEAWERRVQELVCAAFERRPSVQNKAP
ncbi:uncharacterized protein LAESUDRAFT_646931 [Laetiporus sulphureus 93-53]|uniref:Metaxin glutathione S-transferase domain-containing protein n=1 Tax=Laetiporus sulphureus 93-53 TaxID=1314785 RepID=A0A165G266_9APHY|nr:uncharacterized protein LAESUDRAFT_646931 [Laetiporus sulphureus 93-53]KZT09728.1 hypothetical protein LAESUDRAFT_646931 [Laetiporus sulphureus 93-53]